jgi:lipopolysaccharide transport system ATP-binding protein
MSVVIQVDRLSKQYRLGVIGGKRLVDDVNRWWAKLRGKEDPLSKVGQPKAESRKQKTEIKNDGGHDKFQLSTFPISDLRADTLWALRDVTFEVKQGEVLGIIGRNGAGKSTLLKILSRVTGPTSGEVRVKGRIASLLEVGTGFHPELTGRENIYLNGAILGMTKAEIRAKFDEIVEFSDVEQFIDTPVKRYSSGMTVRLAFAVAAHLEPEILIVDEVLAVGDATFQKKCIGKMQDVAGQGRTVLFVSHNMVAVQSLCRRGLLLEQGTLVKDAAAAEVIHNYLKGSITSREIVHWDDPASAPGNDVVRYKRVAVTPRNCNGAAAFIAMETPIQLAVEYWVMAPGRKLHLTFHLLNDQGIVVLTSGFRSVKHDTGEHVAICEIPGNLLNSGGYHVKMLVVENGNRGIHTMDNVVHFEVIDAGPRSGSWMGREPGIVQPLLRWHTKRMDEIPASAY